MNLKLGKMKSANDFIIVLIKILVLKTVYSEHPDFKALIQSMISIAQANCKVSKQLNSFYYWLDISWLV